MVCNTTVQDWQLAVTKLSDDKFFDMMRLYLGEIKTPYNKQKLISQLASFIRNEENLNDMISLLDEFDIKVLTAITFIPKATYSTITDFFATEYSMAEIYSELSNLTARLFVYVQKEEYGSREFLRVNPLVWDKLESYIKISNILESKALVSYSMDDVFSISPNFIAAFISYINHVGCGTKADGTLRKNDLNRLAEIFPDKAEVIQLLINAFLNLNLIREGEKSFEIDLERFEVFGALTFDRQCALLCAASCSRFSRDGLKKEAQLLLDCISSIPEGGYTRSCLIKLAFLVGSYSESGTATPAKSRFASILQAARQEKTEIDTDQAGNLIDRMIDSAITLGLLQKKGILEGGENVYIKGMIFENPMMFDVTGQNSNVKLLNIESSFSITLMPGLPLIKLLPLAEFLCIKRNGVVTEFEITRQSVSAAFDKGWNPEKVFEELEAYTPYELPQNLKISILDWYNSYSSARLYQGFVLKVAESNISFVENNPNIKAYIKEKLAEGIYLLNIPVNGNSEINEFIEKSGLDFMGKIKNPAPGGQKLPFPLLNAGRKMFISADEVKAEIKFNQAGELLSSLKSKLEEMNVDKNQKESLQNRIHQRLILNQKHLQNTSVRIEILEAEGMDYNGKIHLIDSAMKNGDILEIKLPAYSLPGVKDDGFMTIIGKPLGLSKQPGEAILRFEVEPEKNIENIVVSRITYLRRLKF